MKTKISLAIFGMLSMDGFTQHGYYHVTICTQDRIERFGNVVDGEMNLNDAGEMVDAEWNRIPERYGHVVVAKYQIIPNHVRGILQIFSLENEGGKTNDPGSVGRGLVPLLNEEDESIETRHNLVYEPKAPVLNDGDRRLENGIIGGDKIHTTTPRNIISKSGRMGIKPIPTPLYDIIGTFKSLTQNEYTDHVRNKGWPAFRKRLWQLRCNDRITRNEDELNRIRKYIEDNPKN